MSRGFTLIELMVAVLIGSATVVVAAKVAETILIQSAKGRQATDFGNRSRLLGRQLREDIRAVGLGSSGAIAVNPADPGLGAFPVVATAGNRSAIPAVVGANNLPGGTAFAGSDAVQLVVPNPTTQRFATLRAPANTNQLAFANAADAAPFTGPACNYIYVNDQSGPAGRGRVALLSRAGVAGAVVNLNAGLPFTVAPGSAVLCARISTYYLDTNSQLIRSDWTGGGTAALNGAGTVRFDVAGNQVMAAGVEDFQIAYRVSAELHRIAGRPTPPGVPGIQWVFAGQAGNPDGDMTVASSWFEVRQIRFNILSRRLREIVSARGLMAIQAREDRNVGTLPPLFREWSPTWMTTSEVMTNLLMFDQSADEGMEAEPF